jgi:hypothetical protein
MGGGSTTYSFNQPGSASNILANVINAQWQNYQAQLVPQENKLIQWATNPNGPLQAAQQAQATTGAQFNAQQQGLNKTLRSEGITLTPDQQAALTRQKGVSETVASDDAANRAGQAAYNNQQMALTGSPGPTSLPAGTGAAVTGPGLT